MNIDQIITRYYRVILFCFALLLYGNTIMNGYSLDDEVVVTDVPMVEKGIRGLPEIFTTPHFYRNGVGTDFRPIAKSTYAIEYAIFKGNPHISHAIQLVLLILLLWQLFVFFENAAGKPAARYAMFATVLFMFHPILTEVVASLKNREEILAALFGFSAWNVYIRHQKDPHIFRLILATILLALAALSKLSIITFAALIPLFLFLVKKERRISFFVPVLLSIFVGFAIRFASMGGILLENVSDLGINYLENPLGQIDDITVKLGMPFATLFHYFKLITWPTELRYYYGFDVIPMSSIGDLYAIAGILILGGIILLTVVFRKSVSFVFFMIYFLVSMLMYLNAVLISAGILSERALFIPIVGIAGAFAFLLNRLKGNTAYYFLIPYMIIGSILTISRNADWKDTLTLFEADMPKLERSVIANTWYATKLKETAVEAESESERLQMLDKAVTALRRANDIYPGTFRVCFSLADIYFYELNDARSALPFYEAAYEDSDGGFLASYELARVHHTLGNTDKAIQYYLETIRKKQDSYYSYYFAAQLYFDSGRTDEAFELTNQFIKIAPQSDLGYLNLGVFYERTGDIENSIDNYEKAVLYGTRDPGLLNYLSGYFGDAGDIERSNYYAGMISSQ